MWSFQPYSLSFPAWAFGLEQPLVSCSIAHRAIYLLVLSPPKSLVWLPFRVSPAHTQPYTLPAPTSFALINNSSYFRTQVRSAALGNSGLAAWISLPIFLDIIWIPSNHLSKQAVGDEKEWTEKGQQIHSTGGLRSCKDSVSQAPFRNTEKYSALSTLIPCKRVDLAALKRKSPGIRPGSFVFSVWLKPLWKQTESWDQFT